MDAYADSLRAAGDISMAPQGTGVEPKIRTVTFETAAAFAAGDIVRLFQVSAHEIPIDLRLVNDAIAGLTDVDLGLYRPQGGAVIDLGGGNDTKDILRDGVDMHLASTHASPVDGLGSMDVVDRGIKSFADLAGDAIGAIPDDSYDVAMTINSDVSAAGTITAVLTTISSR